MSDEKEINIDNLIQDWKFCYETLIKIGMQKLDTYRHNNKYKFEMVNSLFNKQVLDELSNDELKTINELCNELHKEIIHFNINNNLLTEEQKTNLLRKIFSIYDIFINANNKEIKVIIDLIHRNYCLISEIEKNSEVKLKNIEEHFFSKTREIANYFTTEADNRYLYGVYRNEVKKVSRRIIFNQILFYALLIGMFFLESKYINLTDINNEIISLVVRIFTTIPIVWAILFVLRIIKEDRKLEQAYRHKELITMIYQNFHDRYDINNEIRKTLSQIAIESLRLNPALLLDKSTAEKIPMEELLMQIVSKNSEKSDDKQGQN